MSAVLIAIGVVLLGLLIGTFINEIVEWGRNLYDQWRPQIRYASLFIQKVGNKIISVWKYVTHGKRTGEIEGQGHVLTKEEIEQLKQEQPEIWRALQDEPVEVQRYEN